MDETVIQIGELLLGSVPTIIYMLLLWGAYAMLVHRPLMRVLGERHDRTEGAVEKARADIAAAEERTADYERRLREARLTVFKAQEARRQQAAQVRSNAVAEARTKAQSQIAQAKDAIENDKQLAQANLEAESGRLAAEVIRTVLKPASAGARQ
jgi:F-type H+-transporting ATPase subunit b